MISFTFASGEISIGSTPPIKTACRSELMISSRAHTRISLGSESICPCCCNINSGCCSQKLIYCQVSKLPAVPQLQLHHVLPALRGIQPKFCARCHLLIVKLQIAHRVFLIIAHLLEPQSFLLMPVSEEIAEISLPAAHLIRFAFNFSLPLLANGAIVVTFIDLLWVCL